MNYGATLHGWAFQQVLRHLGCESVVIDYIPKSLTNYHFKWPVLEALRSWRHPIMLVRRVAQWMVSTLANLRKWRKFQDFKRTRLVCTPRTYNMKSLTGAASIVGCESVEVFVCEADVIWKRSVIHGFDPGFYLDFPASARKRKVAYAPSVGKDPFPSAEQRKFIEYIKRFDAVSSRERSGAEYIGSMIGREVPYLPDPTLLLDASDYAAIAKPPSEKGYVLLYASMRANVNMIREAKRYAKRLGKRLVEVSNFGINRFIFGHKVIDDAGVEEWLGLFMNADVIICNAFHGICFSLIFHKPFFAFRRSEDDWRFTGICTEFGLTDRLMEADGRIPKEVKEIDFAEVGRLRAIDAERARRFICENIVRYAKGASDGWV